MRVFRSSLFLAIVSLLVVTGYAWDVLDYCCDDDGQVQVVHAKDHSGKKAPESKKSDCKCICHQIFPAPEVRSVQVDPRLVLKTDYVGQLQEFPPDSVPRGIDYPPQLS